MFNFFCAHWPLQIRGYDSLALCDTCHTDAVHVNVGGPVWSLAWCPVNCSQTASQYLSVYTHRHASDSHSFDQPSCCTAVIQLYDCGILGSRYESDILDCDICTWHDPWQSSCICIVSSYTHRLEIFLWCVQPCPLWRASYFSPVFWTPH